MHFCFNSINDNAYPTQNATLSDSKVNIDYNGNVTCASNLTAGSITGNSLTTSSTNTGLYLMNGGNAIITGKISVGNLFPMAMLQLGSAEIGGSDPGIIFGKNNSPIRTPNLRTT